MTATIYQFPDLMPKNKNTLQALVDEIVAEILASHTVRALDDKLMTIHGGRPFHYEIGYNDEAIEIVIGLKYNKDI
jgi:hypothetical protein